MAFLLRALTGLLLTLLLVAPAWPDQILLNIRPTSGIGPLSLGMAMGGVEKQLGRPDETASAQKALSTVTDVPKSMYSLVSFDTEWLYTQPGVPFYKLLFKDGRLVFIVCTYKRMGTFKLAKNGKMLPPLTKAMVKDVFGAPSDPKRHLGKFKHMMYSSPDGSGMGFAFAGPGEKPVGMLMFAAPSNPPQAVAGQVAVVQAAGGPVTAPAKAAAPAQASAAKGCLRAGEAIDDPRAYVERFYRCENLLSAGQLALEASVARMWAHAEESGFIDQPFTIMGNDHDIQNLSVSEHALNAFNPHAIEQVIRASFTNFGEAQTIEWVFQDDLNDQQPMKLADIRGVSPAAYSLVDYLQSLPQPETVPVPAARPLGAVTAPAAAGQPASGPSIAGYYGALQASGLAPDLRYDLRPEGGRWVTISPDWGTPMPVTVDEQNGYVRILDEGTGGGSFETQIRLWRGSGGAVLIGIAETALIQPGQDPARVRFFELAYGAWSEQTGYVWPDLALADFMAGEMTIADLRDLIAIGAAVDVTFSKGKLDAEAALVVPDETVRAVCQGEDWFVPADKGPYLRYCERLAGTLFRVLPLHWKAEEGRFVKGEPQMRAEAPKTCVPARTLIQEAADNVRAATIFEFDCNGTRTRIYQYRDFNSFRVIHPPKWGSPIGDYKTYEEALAAAVAAGGG